MGIDSTTATRRPNKEPSHLRNRRAASVLPVIMPGLDGQIFYRDLDGMQELPYRMTELSEEPIRLCPDDEETCGIVAGSKSTKFFALDGTNRVDLHCSAA